METKDAIHERLQVADRAAAAPHLAYAGGPWWMPLAFGGLVGLLALGVHLSIGPAGRDTLGLLLIGLVTAAASGYTVWQYRQRGVVPSGAAPAELRRLTMPFAVGAVLLVGGLLALAVWAPLWLSLPTAFLVTVAGSTLYGRAYAAAVDQVRKRLA